MRVRCIQASFKRCTAHSQVSLMQPASLLLACEQQREELHTHVLAHSPCSHRRTNMVAWAEPSSCAGDMAILRSVYCVFMRGLGAAPATLSVSLYTTTPHCAAAQIKPHTSSNCRASMCSSHSAPCLNSTGVPWAAPSNDYTQHIP
jgi:hypothetical protein